MLKKIASFRVEKLCKGEDEEEEGGGGGGGGGRAIETESFPSTLIIPRVEIISSHVMIACDDDEFISGGE
jgi:hypothetical protein